MYTDDLSTKKPPGQVEWRTVTSRPGDHERERRVATPVEAPTDHDRPVSVEKAAEIRKGGRFDHAPSNTGP